MTIMGVRFTFFCKATGITRMTDYDFIQEILEGEGLESAAQVYMKEILESTGVDVQMIADPRPALSFCSFVELKYDPILGTVTEGRREKCKV